MSFKALNNIRVFEMLISNISYERKMLESLNYIRLSSYNFI